MTSNLRMKRWSKTFYNKKTKIWHGENVKAAFGSKDSIGSVALTSLLRDPLHITQICYPSGKEYTNQEIAELSIRVALHFKKLHMEQCDIIGLCAANSDFLAPLAFGALLTGLTISTLDPSFDRDGITHAYSITRPKLMFCDGNIYEKVKDALVACNLLTTTIYTLSNHLEGVPSIMEFFEETLDEHEFKAPALVKGSDQVAMVLCSSGTTGLPKGVSMSHASILNGVEYDMLPQDKYLCFSTLYWLTGLLTLIHGTIQGVTRIISNRAFNTDDFFDIVQRYKVNIILSPPSQIAMAVSSEKIKHSDLSSIEVYLAGGSAVPYVLLEKFKQYAPNVRFITGYGMSETCSFITFTEAEPKNSVGQLKVNVEIKIIDEDGNNLDENGVGEIYIRTKYPWAGYVNNTEATSSIYDHDRWIHSGDVGYFDSTGNLYIVDRKKDILKYNNFHFYPTDIENTIMEIPDVIECCVVGIPDMIATHLPAAAIVRCANSTLTDDEIYQHVAKKRQNFEHLRGGVYFFDSLPRTVSGKTLRREVAKVCENIRKKQIAKNNDNIRDNSSSNELMQVDI